MATTTPDAPEAPTTQQHPPIPPQPTTSSMPQGNAGAVTQDANPEITEEIIFQEKHQIILTKTAALGAQGQELLQRYQDNIKNIIDACNEEQEKLIKDATDNVGKVRRGGFINIAIATASTIGSAILAAVLFKKDNPNRTKALFTVTGAGGGTGLVMVTADMVNRNARMQVLQENGQNSLEQLQDIANLQMTSLQNQVLLLLKNMEQQQQMQAAAQRAAHKQSDMPQHSHKEEGKPHDGQAAMPQRPSDSSPDNQTASSQNSDRFTKEQVNALLGQPNSPTQQPVPPENTDTSRQTTGNWRDNVTPQSRPQSRGDSNEQAIRREQLAAAGAQQSI